jgi:60 kDa SS-A/Ro ribonucleoprotein
MRTNAAIMRAPTYTFGGATATPTHHLSIEQQLRRTVMSCMLWEKEFYEDGKTIADRITELAAKAKPAVVASLAIEARDEFNLRHVPLLLCVLLLKHGENAKDLIADTIAHVVRRADEPGELLSLFWKLNGRKAMPRQMRLGLQRAFKKFDAYQLAKYDRNSAVKLRDVIKLVRPKPDNDNQSALWKQVKLNELAAPDTWEAALTSGADKKETFTRLLTEGKLGYLALLRNLRNMATAGVDTALVKAAIIARKGHAERAAVPLHGSNARCAPVRDRT